MKKYQILFEFYGRKMKTTVLAKSEKEANEQIEKRIIFHKVEEIKNDDLFSDLLGDFKDIFNILGKNK
jgi:hypothetical protein